MFTSTDVYIVQEKDVSGPAVLKFSKKPRKHIFVFCIFLNERPFAESAAILSNPARPSLRNLFPV